MFGGATCSVPHPELPDGGERWGLNALNVVVKLKPRFVGWTRWFDLHPTEFIKARKHNVYPWECKAQPPQRVVRFWPDPDMPACWVYPHAEVQAHFGGTRFFTSSFDWMMALAIYEYQTQGLHQHIDLFGWKMQHINYTHQVKSGQFWIRKAVEAGIDIQNHSKSMLFTVNYSLEEPDMTRWKMYGLETTKRGEIYSHRWR